MSSQEQPIINDHSQETVELTEEQKKREREAKEKKIQELKVKIQELKDIINKADHNIASIPERQNEGEESSAHLSSDLLSAKEGLQFELQELENKLEFLEKPEDQKL